MQRQFAQKFEAPHQSSAKIFYRYFEYLMEFTHHHPVLAARVVDVAGAASLALTAYGLGSGSFISTGAGLLGSGASLFTRVMQRNIGGFPLPADHQEYIPARFTYESATGEMIIEQAAMPLLRVRAGNHFDAGYVEGYMLGEQLDEALRHTDFLYDAVSSGIELPDSVKDIYDLLSHAKRYAVGGEKDNARLAEKLAAIRATIPKEYVAEMQGKVAGYNAWSTEHHPNAARLSFEYYLMLQILPDFLNYKPFANLVERDGIVPDLVTQLGCTTIALRLGEVTAIARILDWPSHGFAGRSILQLDKQVEGFRRTVDISTPVVSGALTVLNEDGLLVEINVSHGDRVLAPGGMPAIFFNRYCAEHAATVEDIHHMIDVEGMQPAGPYHLTASDGMETRSFHFYQCDKNRGDHAHDRLSAEKSGPQLLLVANHGIKYDGNDAESVNHRDSDERKANLHAFFRYPVVQARMTDLMEKQADKLSPDDIANLEEMLLSAARLPLVRNAQSVLCAFYIYEKGKLISARAASDNNYAQDRDLSEFKSLTMPMTGRM